MCWVYNKKCPNCEIILQYKTKNSYDYSVKHNVLCKSCRHIKTLNNQVLNRFCPNCGDEIFYTNLKNRNSAEKLKRICRKCNLTHEKCVAKGKASYAVGLSKLNFAGKCNPFYGHKHTNETKNKLRAARIKNNDIWQTKEHRAKMSKLTSGKNNPMYGKTYYEIWVNKYGSVEADKRMERLKKQLSKRSVGENNPMYGRPTPQGAGNGWSGWYKGWFFRSLCELSYVLNILEQTNHAWQSAEHIIINWYDWQGKRRTYRPDFLHNNYLIECKPQKLHNTPTVKAKRIAAETYCRAHNLTYLLTDAPKIDEKQLFILYINNIIIFTERYKEKMEKWIQIHKGVSNESAYSVK